MGHQGPDQPDTQAHQQYTEVGNKSIKLPPRSGSPIRDQVVTLSAALIEHFLRRLVSTDR
jgi:hypothetical protein